MALCMDRKQVKTQINHARTKTGKYQYTHTHTHTHTHTQKYKSVHVLINLPDACSNQPS